MKNNKPITILSVDFDYFQKFSDIAALNEYPDGHDFGTELSTFIWSFHYAVKSTADIIYSVDINQTELDILQNIIKSHATSTPNAIVNSHKHIYDFVKRLHEKYQDRKIIIWNIDTHQDYENHSRELDCGNWVKHVMQDFDATVHWISNEQASRCYAISKDIAESGHSISILKDMKFDGIFLCRSDIWSPPHLDIYFDKIAKTMQSVFRMSTIEPSVLKPRQIEKITLPLL